MAYASHLSKVTLIVICRHRPDCLDCDADQDVRIHVTSPEQQTTYLSSLDDLDAVKAIVPLASDGVLTDDERQLYDLLHTQTSGSLDDLDGGERPVQPAEQDPSGQDVSSVDDQEAAQDAPSLSHALPATPSPPLIVLAFSCIAAFLSLLCICVAVYSAHYLRSVLRSDALWDLLPRLENGIRLEDAEDDGTVGGSPSEEKNLIIFDEKVNSVVLTVEEKPTEGRPADVKHEETSAPSADDEEDLNEKYEDAEDDLPLLTFSVDESQNPPHIVVDQYEDPDLLPLPSSPTPFFTPELTPDRSLAPSPVLPHAPMREMSSSPVSKPAWSLRAADAPSLGLAIPSSARSSPSGSPRIPGALFDLDSPTDEADTPSASVDVPGRRRAYRAPVPELDIAFALQLRPGLGLGADPAWLVRFLMAMFGWMTVLIGGGGGRMVQ